MGGRSGGQDGERRVETVLQPDEKRLAFGSVADGRCSVNVAAP
jgi:hypothetical protein